MRLPDGIVRSVPVYAGWHFEHTSTVISRRVERVVKTSPQDVQRTVAITRVGCLVMLGSFVESAGVRALSLHEPATPGPMRPNAHRDKRRRRRQYSSEG
jgi:hypothetical protein